MPFTGFPPGKTHTTPIPAAFFTELLPQVDHLGELKVTLYAIWRLDRMEGAFRCLRRDDFSADERLLAGLSARPKEAQAALDDALERAVQRGTLLSVRVELPGLESPGEGGAAETGPAEIRIFYFLNSPRGRAARQAFEQGQWRPADLPDEPLTLERERPNVFQLYEEHIGPLTPLIADALRDAEQTYPLDWIEEALRIAVEKNVRNWRYVSAILRKWKEKGHEQDREKPAQDGRKYVEGEFADFIEH